MSVLNLEKLMNPRSVALIGASDNPESLGWLVMKNLIDSDFAGPVWPVNPKYDRIQGREAFPDVDSLPEAPDLAVICTPAAVIPELIGRLGEKGNRAVVVLSAGTGADAGDGRSIDEHMLDASRPYGLRILGSNCMGLLLPHIGLNASFSHTHSRAGNLALISQSGALCTTLIDWAKSRGIGFSHFISLGNSLDVDFGDLLNYLSSDAATRGILLYIESIRGARKFMSAARATARNKPVIVIKAGRFAEGARAAASHTGALAGSDTVFDAAIRRAGMLRVYSIEHLFTAAETLARSRPIRGNRLAILTNGGGPGVLATDALISRGGRLAELEEKTLRGLDECLPETWSKANPVDLIGDGGAKRYVDALRVLLEDSSHDAILVMLVPTAAVDNEEVAREITRQIGQTRKPVLTCWMGGDAVAAAREYFAREGVPNYETPGAAINAFVQSWRYQANQAALMETPPSVPEDFECDRGRVEALIHDALEAGRDVLTEAEAKQVLAAYAIPVVDTRIAADVDEAVALAEEIGYPVALKILSPDISHKSDVGGVLLDIDSPSLLRYAAEGMLNRVRRIEPEAHIEGFTVQKMAQRKGAIELIVGVTSDPIFGPAILFGQGGTAVEIVGDTALALPPLNMKLARDLVEQTRVFRLLRGYRDVPGADLDAICLTLLKISQMVIDHPELKELDINPLFADSKGVLALDARLKIARADVKGTAHLAIRPYPQEEEEYAVLRDGTQVLLRPIKPEDEPAHHEFIRRCSPRDLYCRFFRAVYELGHENLARFTQIDYDREMAFIAQTRDPEGRPETLGVARAVADADRNEAEFAVIVRTDKHDIGLGRVLMDKLIGYCRRQGIRRLVGQTMSDNTSMIHLARRLNFDTEIGEEGTVDMRLELAA